MIPADETAAPDKEHLYHRVGSVRRHSQHILILSVSAGDLLFLGHLLHAVPQVPPGCRVLKFHALRGFFHSFFQHIQHRPVAAVQKVQCLIDALPVFFFADISLTGCVALFNMIVQAGPVSSDLLRQTPAAASDPVKLPDQINGIFYSAGAGIGAEIPGFILFHGSGKQDPGIFLPHRHFNKRIGLVILQHGIVLGPVFLDQIALQHKSFQFRIRYDILKPADPGHHLLNLGALVPAALKVLAHPVAQAHRFSHIDNGVAGIVHQIHAGSGRQLFQFFLNLKI